MSERDGRLPHYILVRPEPDGQPGRVTDAAAVRSSELRPVGGEHRACKQGKNKSPAKHPKHNTLPARAGGLVECHLRALRPSRLRERLLIAVSCEICKLCCRISKPTRRSEFTPSGRWMTTSSSIFAAR